MWLLSRLVGAKMVKNRLFTRVCGGIFAAGAIGVCFTASAADPAPSPSPSPSPSPTPASLPVAPPETESTNVETLQGQGMDREQLPQSPEEDASPGNEAQREGLLQPESGLEQQITEGQQVNQPLFEKPKPLTNKQYEFDLGMSEVFDDNIFLASGHKDSDFITTISPEVKVQLGDFAEQLQSFLTVSYTPSFIVFADHSHEDAIDSDARLDGQWTPSKLTLGVDFRYQHLSGNEIEIAERVRRSLYNGAFTAKYDMTGKVSLEADFYEQTLDFGSNFISSNEWTNRDWFNYNYTPNLTLSAGVAFGYVTISDSTDQYYEQILVRGIYTAAAKLAFTGNAGVEYRQFPGTGISNRFTPVFSLGIVYRPYQQTELTLEAFRRVEYSALFVGDNYTSTGVDWTISQRLTSRFLIKNEGGFAYIDYQSSGQALFGIASYSYFYIKPEISYEFTSWLKGDIFYEFRDKATRQAGAAFSDNQVGIEANMSF